jgi:hypothetical protein
MELSEGLDKFQQDIDDVKRAGKNTVEIANLERYIADLRKQASMSAEERRLNHMSSLAAYTAQNEVALANFRAIMDAGKEAVNASIVVNGGAVIALLAFMGNASAKYGPTFLQKLSFPVLVFGVGVLLGAVGFCTRYVCQFLYASEKTKLAGHIFNAISWCAILFSLLGFAYGTFSTYSALSQ